MGGASWPDFLPRKKRSIFATAITREKLPDFAIFEKNRVFSLVIPVALGKSKMPKTGFRATAITRGEKSGF